VVARYWNHADDDADEGNQARVVDRFACKPYERRRTAWT